LGVERHVKGTEPKGCKHLDIIAELSIAADGDLQLAFGKLIDALGEELCCDVPRVRFGGAVPPAVFETPD
jgi:sialic acid synthase SpsE